MERTTTAVSCLTFNYPLYETYNEIISTYTFIHPIG
jgi:hypothetical protein